MRDEGCYQSQDPWQTGEEVAEGTGPAAGSPINTPGLLGLQCEQGPASLPSRHQLGAQGPGRWQGPARQVPLTGCDPALGLL